MKHCKLNIYKKPAWPRVAYMNFGQSHPVSKGNEPSDKETICKSSWDLPFVPSSSGMGMLLISSFVRMPSWSFVTLKEVLRKHPFEYTFYCVARLALFP